MTTSKLTEMCCALLNCGYCDLDIFENCQYDFETIVEEAKANFGEINFNNLFIAMITMAMAELARNIDDAIATRKIPKKAKAIDVFDDIDFFANYSDSHIYFNNNEEIYRKYYAKEIKAFEEAVGLTL